MTVPRTPLTDSLTATGATASIDLGGHFNLSISGLTAGSGTIQLQRSFDSGSNWKVVKSYTADIEETGIEPEIGLIYRLECTVFSSGTFLVRLSFDPVENH